MPTVNCYCSLPAGCNQDPSIARFHVKVTVDGVTTSDNDYSCSHNCCGLWYCMRPPISSSSSSSSRSISSRSGSSSASSSLSGSGSVTVACCANPISTTLFATVTNNSACACVGTTVVTLIYNSSAGNWQGSALFGSCGARNIELVFKCQEGSSTFNLDMTFSDGCATTLNGGGMHNCSPFQWAGGIGNNDLVTCGCAGPFPSLDFLITE